mgnify:CR=1 FL=1
MTAAGRWRLPALALGLSCLLLLASCGLLHAQPAQPLTLERVMADPDWCGGRYLEEGKSPRKGLAVARMAAHITYLSDAALHDKFGRNLQDREKVTFGFDADFQVESYLRHQGSTFVERFDANSYLYITRAMDYFDLAADHAIHEVRSALPHREDHFGGHAARALATG